MYWINEMIETLYFYKSWLYYLKNRIRWKSKVKLPNLLLKGHRAAEWKTRPRKHPFLSELASRHPLMAAVSDHRTFSRRPPVSSIQPYIMPFATTSTVSQSRFEKRRLGYKTVKFLMIKTFLTPSAGRTGPRPRQVRPRSRYLMTLVPIEILLTIAFPKPR